MLRLLGSVCQRPCSAGLVRLQSSAAAFVPKPDSYVLEDLLPPRRRAPRKKGVVVEAPNFEKPKAPMVAVHPVHRTTHFAPPNERQPIQPRSSSGKPDAAAAKSGATDKLAFTSASDASTTASEGSASESESVVTVEPTEAADAPKSQSQRMFAVISLGGTQYKVTPGDIINAEHIPDAMIGSMLKVTDVHLVGSKTMSLLGRPLLPQAEVHLEVREQAQSRKIVVFKKRRRKRYQRTYGHRRMVTILRVADIKCDVPAYVQ